MPMLKDDIDKIGISFSGHKKLKNIFNVLYIESTEMQQSKKVWIWNQINKNINLILVINFKIILLMGGCCVQRCKYDSTTSHEIDFYSLNSIPTYENIYSIYKSLNLPYICDEVLTLKKEQMFFMIINLLRVKPKVFLP